MSGQGIAGGKGNRVGEEVPPEFRSEVPGVGPAHRLALLLAADGTAAPAVQRAGDAPLDDARVMQLAEWAYLHVEEVWSAFNLLGEAVARGFRVQAPTPEAQATLDAWNDRVRMPEKVRMWVKNALIYGRCTMEVGKDFLKVRNPRSIELEQDAHGNLAAAWQLTPDGKVPIPLVQFRVFTLHRLFSDDLRGISAVQPVLQTVDDMLETRNVNRVLGRRYRTPMHIVELPQDATDADMAAVAELLRKAKPGTDLILPPGAKVHTLGHGGDALQPDAMMREHLTDRIFLGLGVPKVALGIPDGSNRTVGEVQREMLLADKVAPYQRQVKEFAEALYADLFGEKPEVRFEHADARDERELAEVSRILVEAGIKTVAEVSRHYWNWDHPK